MMRKEEERQQAENGRRDKKEGVFGLSYVRRRR